MNKLNLHCFFHRWQFCSITVCNVLMKHSFFSPHLPLLHPPPPPHLSNTTAVSTHAWNQILNVALPLLCLFLSKRCDIYSISRYLSLVGLYLFERSQWWQSISFRNLSQYSPFLSMNRWGSYWLKFVSMKAKTAALRHPWGLVQRILSEGQMEVCPWQLALGQIRVFFCCLIQMRFGMKADLKPVEPGWNL